MKRTSANAPLKIALFFNRALYYDRGILLGIGAYVRDENLNWRLQLMGDPQGPADSAEAWDAVIANFDNSHVSNVSMRLSTPVVAVSSAMTPGSVCPPRTPRVASDNFALIELACEHLHQRGLPEYAFYGKPKYLGQVWAEERQKAFAKLMSLGGHAVRIFDAQDNDAETVRDGNASNLKEWLKVLPKPCGIVAVNDSSAQELLYECNVLGISIPDEIAVVGIDNDQIATSLSCIPITSVVQDTEGIGRAAAKLLHRRLCRVRIVETCVLVPPARIVVTSSSMYEQGMHPLIIRARNFIRQFAGHGIKSDQVADYLHVSNSTIERLFRMECGCSVHDEILRVRLDMAKQLLESGELSSAEVASRCGFRTPQYMHVVFKRELGCTPSEYQSSSFTQQASASIEQCSA
ncbi:MAG TPA: substrate-binding domain-containing protein [Rhodocyclaceae bacterium]|nr:substrate-binding domain-containing protein [Rhodocyclaceae bacterium]